MGLKVGIDFGTSNSGVAVFDGRQVHLLPVDRQNLVPEVVKTIIYITKDHQCSIGQQAVELYYRDNVNRPRRFVKKWVGEIDFVGSELEYVRDVYVYVDELKPGRLLQFIKSALRSGSFSGTTIFDRYYSLGDIITLYLRELKQRAEKMLSEPLDEVFLGRPVYFSKDLEQDRNSEEILRQAAYEAGFNKVDFEYEPVAAALDFERRLTHPQNALIFDFGGGTLDITVMRLGDARGRQVYASGGIGIAGSDFDRAIIEKRMLSHFGLGKAVHSPEIMELIKSVADWMVLPELSTPQARLTLEEAIQNGIAPVQLKALQSLIFDDLSFSFYNTIEKGKIDLSYQGVVEIMLKDRDIDLWELYTRSQFEKDIREYHEQIEQVLLDTVIASGLEPEQIDVVVKTGGSSSIPAFNAMLANIFGEEKIVTSDVFSSVTSGLALRAYYGDQRPGWH
jgi:hypothetical chaperone protein